MYKIRVKNEALSSTAKSGNVAFICQTYPVVISQPFEEAYVSIEYFEEQFGEYSRRGKTKLKSTFPEKKVKEGLWKLSKEDYKCENNYVELDLSDLLKIYQLDFANKEDLLLYYLRVLMSLNWKTNLGNQKISYFVNEYDMSEHTVIRYNRMLEELGLIYVVHSSGLDKNANIYCKLEYKDKADKYAKHIGISSSSNDKRSLAMKYRHTIETGEIYSDSEMIRIAEYVVNHNSNEAYEHIKDNNYVPKILNLGPFESYL